ncbi:MAG: methylmalonyl-CoA mutase family protein [Pseudomonadota bacterium]
MEKRENILLDRYKEGSSKNETESGIKLKEYYNPADIQHLSYGEIKDPGQFPFLRGIHANMYRGKIWTRRMLVGFGTARYSNERLKYCLNTGASGLCVVCDTPTQLCIDSDHPLAVKEAGLVGIPFTSLQDMEELLEGIPIDQTSVSFQTPGDPGPIMFSQYVACAQKRGIGLRSLRGSTTNGPVLKLFGYETMNPMDISLKLCVDVIQFAIENDMKFHPLIVGGYVYRENGLTAVQELAICMAATRLYLEESIKRGLDIDLVAPRIAMVFSVGPDFFEEIGKFRAARRMWSKMLSKEFHAKEQRALTLSLSAHTSGISLVARQPLNNIIRSGYEFLSAVMGGCQAVDFSTYDEPFSTPSELASRIALNNQNILAYETGILSVADPLGGSYFVEHLTDQVEQEAWKIYENIMEMGGLLKAYEEGWIDNLIEEQVQKRQKAIESKEKILVGVNEFQIPEKDEEKLPIHYNPPGATEEQVEKLKRLKKERDNKAVERSLKRLSDKLEKDWSHNLIPEIVDAVKCYATIGEIWGTVRQTIGLSFDPFEGH